MRNLPTAMHYSIGTSSPPADAWKLAKQSAINAVTADPKLAEARASLGFVERHYDRDWEGAERELRVAIQLKPGAQVAHRWYAFSLSTMGRHEEALAEMERAREISPQSAVLATAIANVLFLAGRYDEAIAQCRRAMELTLERYRPTQSCAGVMRKRECTAKRSPLSRRNEFSLATRLLHASNERVYWRLWTDVKKHGWC